MQGNLLELRRQRREENAGAAEERAQKEARPKQVAGVQAGPLKQAEQDHVSGKTSSHALQGYTATHVHIAEAQGVQLDSQCFILYNLPAHRITYPPPCICSHRGRAGSLLGALDLGRCGGRVAALAAALGA
jgi:hypothetical protein